MDAFVVVTADRCIRESRPGDFKIDKSFMGKCINCKNNAGVDGLKNVIVGEYGLDGRFVSLKMCYWVEDALIELNCNKTAHVEIATDNSYKAFRCLHKADMSINIFVTFWEEIGGELKRMGECSIGNHTGTSGNCDVGMANDGFDVPDDILVAHTKAVEKASQRGPDVEPPMARGSEPGVHGSEEIPGSTDFEELHSGDEGSESNDFDYWDDVVLADGNSQEENGDDDEEVVGGDSVEISSKITNVDGNNQEDNGDDKDFLDPPRRNSSTYGNGCGLGFHGANFWDPPPWMCSRIDNSGGFTCDDNDFVDPPTKQKGVQIHEIRSVIEDYFVDPPPLVSSSGGNGRRRDNGGAALKKGITMTKIYGYEDVEPMFNDMARSTYIRRGAHILYISKICSRKRKF